MKGICIREFYPFRNDIFKQPMNLKTLLIVMLAACTTCASAEEKAASKKDKSTKAIALEASPKTPATQQARATGPVGFGPIKFGISKDELEALPAGDGNVFLTGPLTVKEMKKVQEGAVWYKGQLKIPMASSSVESTFVFKNEKMTYFSMDLHEVTWEFMQKQIAEKYGAGEVKDDQKEEQCIYKNGSNFKLISGTKSVTWRQVISPTEQITTSATDMQFAICPSSLRDSMFSSKSKWISFSLEPIKRENSTSLF